MEKRSPQKWFCSIPIFPTHSNQRPQNPKNQGNQSPRAAPRILRPTPGDRDEKTCCTCNEAKATEKVDTHQFVFECGLRHFQPHKKQDHYQANSAERKVHVEDPSPCRMLGNCASQQRAKDASNCPGSLYDSIPFGPIPKRHDVGEDDHAHRYDTTTSNTLHASAADQSRKILRYTCHHGS